MRILSIIATLNPSGGGTTQAVRLLHETLLAEGHESEVVCCDDPESTWLTDWNGATGVGRGSPGWSYHPKLVPWLRANGLRFDAVIVHGLWIYPSLAAWRVLGNVPDMPPYWVFPHGMLDPWFQKVPERRIKAVRNWVYWKLIEHRVIRDAAGLLFTCDEEKRLARTTFVPYQPRREKSVGYGIVEPPAFTAAMAEAFADRCPGLGSRPYLLFLGRIHPKKGVDLLIQAYACLCHENGAHTLPALVVAGPGLDSSHGRAMQRLAETLGVVDEIFWPGMLAGDAKWGGFHGCEAFVLPSHQENFGIVVAESLACSKPVLISYQVNIWREIAAEGAGFIDSDDMDGTLRALRRWLAADEQDRAATALHARRCYESHFQVKQTAQRLLDVLTPKVERPELTELLARSQHT